MRDPVELAGPLGTPLGLAQRKRASPIGEAGTSADLNRGNQHITLVREITLSLQVSGMFKQRLFDFYLPLRCSGFINGVDVPY